MKDAGCTSELDYTEQTSWLLFLKYLNALEQDKATEVTLDSKKYTSILDALYRWESWAAPKKDDKIDHKTALSVDDLIQFVNARLFPYLHGFKAKVEISTHFNNKQQVFLDFVLSHYVNVGVEELDQGQSETQDVRNHEQESLSTLHPRIHR